MQCAAIQTALTHEKLSSPQQLDDWTNSFLTKLLERMRKHEGPVDRSSVYAVSFYITFLQYVHLIAQYWFILLHILV